MALKSVIKKEDFEKLSDELKKEYKSEGDDYVLDISGLEEHPQAGALKRAKDRIKEELDEAKTKISDLEKSHAGKVKELEGKIKDLEKSGDNGADVEKLRTEYEGKLEKAKTDHQKELETAKGHVKELLVSNVASSKAKEWSKTPSLLAPEIERRLSVEYDKDGKPQTRILDKEGNISAMSMDDLKAEIYSNKEYEPILIGSRADGGSAPNQGGGNNGGSAPNNQGGGDANDPAQLSNKDLAARVAANRGESYEGA